MESASQSSSSKKVDVQNCLDMKGEYTGESISAGGVNGLFTIFLTGYNCTSISLSKENAFRLAQHIRDYYRVE